MRCWNGLVACSAFRAAAAALLAQAGSTGAVVHDDAGFDAACLLQSAGLHHGAAEDIPTYRLNDGRYIPVIGFGTAQIPPGRWTYKAVKTALEAGYRMFDTAAMYGNEADVGRAIRDSRIPRSEVFVTTKIFNDAHGNAPALAAGRRSNMTLGLGYIDMLLIHSPLGVVPGHGKIVETYDALLDLQREGVTRSVGVSNFGIHHIRALAAFCRPAPAVNQIELHPLIYQDRAELVERCRNSSILVQAFGSLFSGHRELLSLVNDTANFYAKTPAQLLLRWALDQGFQVIPKSVHMVRQKENLDVFDFALDHEDIEALNKLVAPNQHAVSETGSLSDYYDPLNSREDMGDVGSLPSSCS
mmetsp:Transcript_5798/g.17127  ORF Transcript_5798/g.17127 Transcript_5798/m.17127 type:complete len:357 (-) Transcript_5798:122-1192(-)